MKTMMSESMKKEFGRAMRGIALVGVIAGACPPGAWAQQAEAPGALERRVDAAFEAAFPLYEMARARFNAMVNPLNPAPSPVNGTPVNRRNLIDHTARDVTTPNNDTLYSATWLDLHATPVRIRVPRVEGGRYWSVALLDIFTNNFAILGRATMSSWSDAFSSTAPRTLTRCTGSRMACASNPWTGPRRPCRSGCRCAPAPTPKISWRW